MGKVNTLLAERLKKKVKSTKMEKMAEQSAFGNRTGFTGIFSVSDLSSREKGNLEILLQDYSTGNENISHDLRSLISITSEVKAINNQAAILHGERIKQAQEILKEYRDGAFSAWLTTTYGNRQTPYNFLQYYEFCRSLPTTLRPQIEQMPRQAVYTLASREGEISLKQELIENYKGETKQEILALIREKFPLEESDKRREKPGEALLKLLRKAEKLSGRKSLKLLPKQKSELLELLDRLKEALSNVP